MCRTLNPPDVIGACRAGVGKFLLIPDFCNPIAIAGAMMYLHCVFVKRHTGKLYFILAEIVLCNAVQATVGEGCPLLIFEAHSSVFDLNFWIIFSCFVFGDVQIPSISLSMLHGNLLRCTSCPSCSSVSVKSPGTSSGCHFPRFHMMSTKYHHDFDVAIFPPVTPMSSDHPVTTSCIDCIVSSGVSLACNRSQSSTYEKPSRVNSDFDKLEQNWTLNPLFDKMLKIMELNIDHICGPHAFPCKIPCGKFSHPSSMSSPPYVVSESPKMVLILCTIF